MKRLILWLGRILSCHHDCFEYELAGGKGCPYANHYCEHDCSVPVYEVYCKDCGKSWTLGEDELIDFFAERRPEKIEKEEAAIDRRY